MSLFICLLLKENSYMVHVFDKYVLLKNVIGVHFNVIIKKYLKNKSLVGSIKNFIIIAIVVHYVNSTNCTPSTCK